MQVSGQNDQTPRDKRKPIPYDMVYLTVRSCRTVTPGQTVQSERTVTGWWTGSSWDGLRLKEDDVVIDWEKAVYYATGNR